MLRFVGERRATSTLVTLRAALALLLLLAPGLARAQGVTEEVEAGGIFVPELEGEEETPEPEEEEEARRPLVIELPPPRELDGPIAPAPITFTLENGLRVMLQPIEGRRFSAVAMTYHVGSADQPSGWTGLAHLTEHLMFAGTDVLNEVEVFMRLEAAGAVERNAETSPDRTIYYEVLPSAQLEWAFWIEAERLARMLAGLTEARLDRQRQIVLHEGFERGIYGWRGLLAQSLFRGVFPDGHPYAQPVIEREEDVRAVRLRHVQSFFQRHYAPDNATLSVVGGFDPEVIRASIERHFGPIRRSAPAPDAPRPDPVAPLDHERQILLEVQHDRDQVYVAWPTPALYAAGDAELDVLSTLMGRRRTAPVRDALVESGLALEALVQQRSYRDASLFTIQAVPAPGHDAAELVRAIDEALARVHEAPFDEEAVREAREIWARRERLRVEDLATRAIHLGTATDAYVPTLENERQRYLTVDAEAVRRTVQRWLPQGRRLVMIARAEPSGAPQGRVILDRRRPQ